MFNIYKVFLRAFIIILALFFTGFQQLNANCNEIDFDVNNTSGCEPELVRFVVTGAPENTTYEWDFGNGTINTTNDTIYRLYSTAGNYTVSLTAKLPGGAVCQAITKDNLINIHAAPEPEINVTPTQIMCEGPEQATITDQTPNVATRTFLIENESYEDAPASITHNFTSVGSKNITLEIVSNDGCQITKTFNEHIIIQTIPNVAFCANITQTENTTQAIFSPNIQELGNRNVSEYQWTFENGSIASSTDQSPTVTYNASPEPSDVSLEITTEDGCIYSKTIDDAIIDFMDVEPNPACAQEEVFLENNAAGTGRSNFSWFFPGAEVMGGSPSTGFDLKYHNPGNYNTNLSFTYPGTGCTWNVSFPGYLEVLGPRANFTVQDRLECDAPHEITLNNNSNVPSTGENSYYWEIRDANTGDHAPGSPIGPGQQEQVEFTILDTGIYDIILGVSNTNGCIDTAKREGYVVVQRPVVDFIVETDTVCLGENVIINNESFPSPSEFNWHQYDWYIVHQDSQNVSDTITEWYTEKPDPLEFEPDVPGNYDIWLVVDTEAECRDTIVKQNVLHVKGIHAETSHMPDYGCVGETFTITANILINVPDEPENKISHLWKIPDDLMSETGNHAGEVITIHQPDSNDHDLQSFSTDVTIDSAGCFQLELVMMNHDGCERIILTEEICVGQVPDFNLVSHDDFNDTIYCRAIPIQIENQSLIASDYYQWETTAPGAKFYPSDTSFEPEIVFPEDGCYELTLHSFKISGNDTCAASVTKTLCPNSPNPEFTADNTTEYCAPVISRFTNTSEDMSWSFIWDYGDGTTHETGSTRPAHTYLENNPGGYNISLMAEDQYGCKDTMMKEGHISVTGPVPDFIIEKKIGCDQVTTSFTNKNEHVDKFLFDYGDGSSPDSMQLRTHTYSVEGGKDSSTYLATMIAEDTDGCVAYKTDTVRIFRSVSADFESEQPGGCLPHTATFEALDISEFATYAWDLTGDGIFSDTGQTVSHTYTDSQNYTVTLIAESVGGCRDTLIREEYVQIGNPPNVDFAISENEGCGPLTVEFENNSTSYTDFIIDYGLNGDVDTNNLDPYTYLVPENQLNETFIEVEVKLSAFNSWGCYDEQTHIITLYSSPQAKIITSKDTICSKEPVFLSGESVNATSWKWDANINGEINSTDQHFELDAQLGNNNIRLIAENDAGCIDTVDLIPGLFVTEGPNANYFVSEQYPCFGEKVFFNNVTQSPNQVKQWSWYFDGPGSTPVHVQHPDSIEYNDPGTYNSLLVVEDIFGCIDTATQTIEMLSPDIYPRESIHYVSMTDTTVFITWSPGNRHRIDSFTIEREDEGTAFDVLTNIRGRDTVYNDAKNINFEEPEHCYRIFSTDECGTISEYSSRHCPVILEVTSFGNRANQLTWSHYQGWFDIAYYSIERRTENGVFEIIDTVSESQNTYIDEGLCDEIYCYRVIAHHPNGKFESVSSTDCNRPPYLHQEEPLVLNYVSVIDNKNIELNWEEGIQPNINQYIIDRGIEGLNYWEEDYATSNNTRYTDENVAVNETAYLYRVRVEDNCDYQSPNSNVGTSIWLRGSIVDDFASIYWNHYEYWANGVLSYKIEIRYPNGSFEEVDFTGGGDTSYVDEELYEDIDTAYCYKVTAIENDNQPYESVSNIRCVVLPSRFHIPNAFSPNDDEINDTFRPIAVSIHNEMGNEHLEYKLAIYNRFGQQLFKTNDLYEGWDGTVNGEPAPEGVYIYEITARGIDYQVHHHKGSVTLIR